MWKYLILALMVSMLILSAGMAGAQQKASAKEGEKIFAERCAICHFPDKTDTKVGPGLKGLFKAKKFPKSGKPITVASLKEWILSGAPQAVPPMPPFKGLLSDKQIGDLIEYLKTL